MCQIALMIAFLATLLFLAQPLEMTPKQIYTDQEAPLFFSLKMDCQNAPCPADVELIQIDPKTNAVLARWKLLDNGLWGDEKPGDQIFSRKVYFKASRPQKLVFYTVPDEQRIVEVIAQPTFLEILEGIYKKIRAKYLFNAT